VHWHHGGAFRLWIPQYDVTSFLPIDLESGARFAKQLLSLSRADPEAARAYYATTGVLTVMPRDTGWSLCSFRERIAVIHERLKIDRQRLFRVRDGLFVGPPPRLAACKRRKIREVSAWVLLDRECVCPRARLH
jgi:hypothetical protein